MKRLYSLFLAMLLLVSMLAGCRMNRNEPTPTIPSDSTNPTNPTDPTEPREANSALEILQTVWDSYGEEEKFAVIGGDPENMIDGAPGDFSLADAEALTYSLIIPADLVPQVDEAASLVHGMLSNNFTCGIVHLKPGTDVSAFALATYNAVQDSKWMCGMPERVIVATLEEEYVLMAYGLEDVLGLFQQKLTTVYPNTQIVYNAAITG